MSDGRRSRRLPAEQKNRHKERLDEAHKHGDIVKSTEVSTFVVLLAGALAIAMFGPAAAEDFARRFRVFLEQPDQFVLDPGRPCFR